jgi:hypothetical protein
MFKLLLFVCLPGPENRREGESQVEVDFSILPFASDGSASTAIEPVLVDACVSIINLTACATIMMKRQKFHGLSQLPDRLNITLLQDPL